MACSVRIELQDAAGQRLPGFSLADTGELFGDSVDHTVTWKLQTDVSTRSGKAIRLRFVLHDADVFAFQFADR